MSTNQASRQAAGNIVNGATIDATDLNNEFNHLVSKHNATDQDLDDLKAGTDSFSGITSTGPIVVDDIDERTSTHGVDIDGVLCKDSGVRVARATDPSPIDDGTFYYHTGTAHDFFKGEINGTVREMLSAVSMPGANTGPMPYSTAVTSVVIPSGGAYIDTTGERFIAATSDLTATITTSGANGLDTGSEAANTWYYLWICQGTSGVCSLLSTSNTTPTLPSGYDEFKALTPGAWRNDNSSNILPGRFLNQSYFEYIGLNRVVANGYSATVVYTGTDTTKATVDLSDFIPPSSRTVRLEVVTNTSNPIVYHENDASKTAAFQGITGWNPPHELWALTNSSQEVGISVNANSCSLHVVGYLV